MQEERSKKSGVFQLEDGNWGYRFIVVLGLKILIVLVEQRKEVERCS